MIIDAYTNIVSAIHQLASQLSGGDSMAKGLITVGILGAAVATLRSTPKRIKSYILRKCTVSVKFSPLPHDHDTHIAFGKIGKFIQENDTRKSRKLWEVHRKIDQPCEFVYIPQEGSGLFFKGWRPYWYTYHESKEQGNVPQAITVTTLGSSTELISKYIDFGTSRYARHYMTPNGEGWTHSTPIVSQSTLFLDPEFKKKIDEKIDFYKNNAKWYRDRGLSHKLLIILHGEPGTGKSSISQYVADRLGYNLGSLNSSAHFSLRMRNAANNRAVVSIPDFDTLGLADRRSGMTNNAELENKRPTRRKDNDKSPESNRDKDQDQNAEILSVFSGLNETLNLFQGDIPVNGLVAVMSTNCIDKIDPALLRGGRCDLLVELPRLKFQQIEDFTKHYYETNEGIPMYFKDQEILACDLMATFMDHPFDRDSFLDELVHKTRTVRPVNQQQPVKAIEHVHQTQ